MGPYKLTRLAERDVLGIWTYIAEENIGAADLVLDYLHDRCLLLSKMPGMGRLREDFAPNLRRYAPRGKREEERVQRAERGEALAALRAERKE